MKTLMESLAERRAQVADAGGKLRASIQRTSGSTTDYLIEDVGADYVECSYPGDDGRPPFLLAREHIRRVTIVE
jgi:hypothetical protein